MKEVIGFLEELEKNNNREWFNAHKDEYRAAQARFDDFAGQLIAGIATFDDSIKNLTVKDCTYRIYRDTRFSSDKRPYKTHLGAFICPEGKKSGYAGYYFQVGPEEEGYDAGTMLASGHYCMEPQALRTLREDICNGDGDFEQTLRQAPDFRLDDEGKLKRVPNGFPKDAACSEYLKYRTYCLVSSPGKAFAMADHLLERTVELFRTTYPFIEYINRAIAFTRDEL